ncbi:hypothetical protein [Mangrovimonas sp. TPBH4]|uniref:hypothetical protein n=1 Tax=Mangrovimonas sp. TPBH4 TaxID=1645914 RepID=UPI000AA28553|nr:hypothetical protein [Mangrovimonas sp. TPBH4]
MRNPIRISILIAVVIFASCTQQKKSNTDKQDAPVTVTEENFALAMSDLAMQREFAQGANNTQWHHNRSVMALDAQPAPLMNRMTTYSFSIVDGGGDVAITLPENDGRYMSLHVWNHDHVTVGVYYGAGKYIIPADKSSDFFVANVRMYLDPNDPEDIKKVNGFQDQLKIEFLNGYEPKPFKVTNWNMEQFEKIHEHYVARAKELGTLNGMATLEHKITLDEANRGVAVATGLLPDKDAMYFTENHLMNGEKVKKVTYSVPEIENPDLGFFSITIYGEDQWLKTDEGSNIDNRGIQLNADGKTFDVYYVMQDEYANADYPNKLLVPSDNFWTCFRVYMPGKTVREGEFILPKF